MAASVLALVTAFAVVFVAELPDKTMVATLVLRPPLPRLAGVRRRRRRLRRAVRRGGGVRQRAHPAAGPGGGRRCRSAVRCRRVPAAARGVLRLGTATGDAPRAAPRPVPFWRAALTSFGVLFAAEWGDASQLATAGLTARYSAPLPVGLGCLARAGRGRRHRGAGRSQGLRPGRGTSPPADRRLRVHGLRRRRTVAHGRVIFVDRRSTRRASPRPGH